MKAYRTLTISALLLCTTAAWAGNVSVGDDISTPNTDFSSVNKSVRIGERSVVGDVDTVNGSIRIGAGSHAGNVESVNGGVRIGAGATILSLELVNGTAELDDDVIVQNGVQTVNGGVRVERGVQIGDNVESVNGRIELKGAVVQGNVETYNGTIHLEGTEVLGDLRVNKPRGFSMNWKKQKPTRVTIGANSVVHGDLYFEKPVELSIHKTAQVNRIHGDEVKMVGDGRMK